MDIRKKEKKSLRKSGNAVEQAAQGHGKVTIPEDVTLRDIVSEHIGVGLMTGFGGLNGLSNVNDSMT